jgi:hypothetical protein
MAWATVTVEMRSRKLDKPISDDFRARSIYEAAWLAMRVWNRNWYWDSEAKYMTVRRGEQTWRGEDHEMAAAAGRVGDVGTAGIELASPACPSGG